MLILQGAGDPQLFGRGPVYLAARITHDVPSGSYDLPVPDGCLVEEVETVVTEAFNGAGAALTAGDAADVDGYLTSANIALATAATATVPAVKKASAAGNPYANGKRITSSGSVRLTWTKPTGATTGSVDIVVRIVNLKNLGIPGGVASTARIP